MRHALLFEIWENPEEGEHAFEMSPVGERSDTLRRQLWPTSILRHSFRAASVFEAFQINHDWHGYDGRWRIPDCEDTIFTAEDAAAQDRYLAVRP